MRKTIDEKVNFTTLVRAEPERVYDALATAEGLDAWFTTGASVDARPEGRIDFRWKDWGHARYTGENGGPVLEARRPNRFVFQWKVDRDSYNTTVEIDFEAVEEGTLVRLIEYGYEDTPSGMKDLLDRATGWGEVLTLMKFYLEHGVSY
ncbi:MAG: SRPBCC domain-containing protein [Blastocatellia bacterium]|nr:SRPBCC domain-containing protein [Blastocatellia bacterium]